MSFCCLVLFLSFALASSEKAYSLTVEKQGNELLLQCHVNNSFQLSNATITFWITDGSNTRLDILTDLPQDRAAQKISETMVSFKLQSKSDSVMFYCGDMKSGERSKGVGPFMSIKKQYQKGIASTPGSEDASQGAVASGFFSSAPGYAVMAVAVAAVLTILFFICCFCVCCVCMDEPGCFFAGHLYTCYLPTCKRRILKVLCPPESGRCFRNYRQLNASDPEAIGVDPAPSQRESAMTHFNPEAIIASVNTSSGGLTIHIEKKIGTGKFGVVYHATYKSVPCAAKLLEHQIEGNSLSSSSFPTQAGEDVFEKNCTFLHSLDNKNIVKHFATVLDPQSKVPVFVMELMDTSLKEYLLDHELTQITLLYQVSLCLDICKGLAYLHSHNITHRNLCDDNVLLNVSGEIPAAKISDYGLSTFLPPDRMISALAEFKLRKVYLSLEVRDDPSLCHASADVYAYGVLATQIIKSQAYLKGVPELRSLYREIPETHPMKESIKSCIFYNMNSRPKPANLEETLSNTFNLLTASQ